MSLNRGLRINIAFPSTRCIEVTLVRSRRAAEPPWFQGVRDVLGGLLDQDLHAKRIESLCNATLGAMHSVSLAVCFISQTSPSPWTGSPIETRPLRTPCRYVTHPDPACRKIATVHAVPSAAI